MRLVTVRFFASLREEMGRGEITLEPGSRALSVREVWAAVAPGRPIPDNVLSAVNHEYVDLDHRVGSGDEVAFFPPVTGG